MEKSCDMSKMLEGLESVSVSVVLSEVEIAHIVSPVKGRLAKLWTLAWQMQECGVK